MTINRVLTTTVLSLILLTAGSQVPVAHAQDTFDPRFMTPSNIDWSGPTAAVAPDP